MTRSSRMFAPKYIPKVIPAPVKVHTPFPQAGASVVVPIVSVETPSSFISKGTSSSTYGVRLKMMTCPFMIGWD